MHVMCDDNKDLIVGYVYDELSPQEQQALSAHLAGCPECQVELEELRATRMHLALWAPPEPDLGFRVIRGGVAPAPALPRRRPLVPAFAYAAAAVIVLAVGAAIANIEVRYGADGMTVRTGWAEQAAQTAAQPASAVLADSAASPAQDVSASPEFAALDKRLREIETAISTRTAAPAVQNASASRMSDAELLRTVRQLVAEAEARQETATARQLLQVFRDFDNQRRADIALIQQGLGQYQGLTNAEIAQNREMLNQFIRAAAKQEK